MNDAQHATLNLLLLLVVVVLATSKRSMSFWKTLLTPTKINIEPPTLSINIPTIGNITTIIDKPNA